MCIHKMSLEIFHVFLFLRKFKEHRNQLVFIPQEFLQTNSSNIGLFEFLPLLELILEMYIFL